MRVKLLLLFILVLGVFNGVALAAGEMSAEELLLFKSLQDQKGIKPGAIDKQKASMQQGQPELNASPSSIEQSFLLKTSLKEKSTLKQFGYDYFSLKYQDQVEYTNIPVGSDYVLGIGDTLTVFIWGKVQQKFSVAIEKDGNIFLPKSGKVSVIGLSLSGAREVIQKSLAKQFANVEINVTLDQLRTINVYTAGEFRSPGGYRVASVATLFHVLYLAGGPTKAGSLRNIQLMRNNRVIATIDLYEYLLSGRQVKKLPLLEGDTIFVPMIGATVGVGGSVKRPAIYEVRGKESIKDLLAIAGGQNASGINQNVQITRIDPKGQRVIIDIKNEPSKLNSIIKDGDMIVVDSVLPAKRKIVRIEGNVRRPGEYALESGMKIADLIKKAEGIIPKTYMSRLELDRSGQDYDYLKVQEEGLTTYTDKKDQKVHYIIPLNLTKIIKNDTKENRALEDGDTVKVLSEKEVDPDRYVYIEGMVRFPGKYPLNENMKLADLVFAAGGAKRGAYLDSAEFIRAGQRDTERVKTISLVKALSNTVDTNNIALKPDDYVYIKEDLEYNPQGKIVISGQVKYPGTYILQRGEKLSSAIRRAGGFIPTAFLTGAVFTRQNLRQNELKVAEKTKKFEEKRLIQQEANLIQSNKVQEAEQAKKLMSVEQSSADFGRLIIDMKPLNEFESATDNIVLKDGDALDIPAMPSAVQVLGGVYSPGGIVHSPDMPIVYYTGKCGLDKFAATDKIYVVKANGSVIEDKTYRPEIGDTIIVPEEIKIPFDLGKTITDVADVIAKIAFTLSVLNTLK